MQYNSYPISDDTCFQATIKNKFAYISLYLPRATSISIAGTPKARE